MSSLAAPASSRGPGSAKSSKSMKSMMSMKSMKSFKSVEYGTADPYAPKPSPSPRFPCCPSVTLPPFMHPAVGFCCPQKNHKVAGLPQSSVIGQFATTYTTSEKKVGRCEQRLVSCCTAIGCRDEKRNRWWWNSFFRKKRQKVEAPISVIGGPLTLSNKPSWAKEVEEGPPRKSTFSRWLKRTCFRHCMKEDPEEGAKKGQGCVGKCGSKCYDWFTKFMGRCYCTCCDSCLCICCKKAADNAIADAAALVAMEAVTAKWNAVADPTKDGKKRGSMDPVTEKPKLDASLVEHNSLIRAAIPILPVPLAWLCLFANTFMPGTGTLSSGILCLCMGKSRFSIYDRPEGRLGAFCLNVIVAIFQVFTVIFCLVGWGWSLWWGVIMVRVARKHRKLRLRALEETSGSNTASTSKDDNS